MPKLDLSDRDRAIIKRLGQGHSVAEVARDFALTENAIRVRLSRARRRNAITREELFFRVGRERT